MPKGFLIRCPDRNPTGTDSHQRRLPYPARALLELIVEFPRVSFEKIPLPSATAPRDL